MFRVDANSLEEYIGFDPTRKAELEKIDMLIQEAAPALRRYFHPGTPPGEPGMRFKMIGYGRYYYLASSGVAVEWPAVGVALQKNYISVYFSVAMNHEPVIRRYVGKLGGLRYGENNFSFIYFDDLNVESVRSLMREAERIFLSEPEYQTSPEALTDTNDSAGLKPPAYPAP